jgi:hypothetical protein
MRGHLIQHSAMSVARHGQQHCIGIMQGGCAIAGNQRVTTPVELVLRLQCGTLGKCCGSASRRRPQYRDVPMLAQQRDRAATDAAGPQNGDTAHNAKRHGGGAARIVHETRDID